VTFLLRRSTIFASFWLNLSWSQRLASAMSHVQDANHIFPNDKQHAIPPASFAVQQLPYLFRKFPAFDRQSASARELFKGLDRPLKAAEPTICCVWRTLEQVQVSRCDIQLSWRLDDDPVFHPRRVLLSRRIVAKVLLTDCPSPLAADSNPRRIPSTAWW
jgi:hypothetical protein